MFPYDLKKKIFIHSTEGMARIHPDTGAQTAQVDWH